MPWAICIKNCVSGKIEVIPKDKRVDDDDPRYGDEIHIVPVKEDTEDPEALSFGVHDFSEECACHPQKQEQCFGRTMIIHSEKVN